jgi:hypothetical protein
MTAPKSFTCYGCGGERFGRFGASHTRACLVCGGEGTVSAQKMLDWAEEMVREAGHAVWEAEMDAMEAKRQKNEAEEARLAAERRRMAEQYREEARRKGQARVEAIPPGEFNFTRDSTGRLMTTAAPVTCPECKQRGRLGGVLVKRSRKDESGTFYGCSNYPKCTFACDDVTEDGRIIRKPRPRRGYGGGGRRWRHDPDDPYPMGYDPGDWGNN